METWRNIILFFSIFGYAVIGCSQDSVSTEPANLLGKWRMIKVIQDGNSIVKPEPYLRRYEVEIEFQLNGKLKGTSSANPLVGTYVAKANGSISVQVRYESKVGENAWGDYFVDAIEDVSTYKIKNKVLHLCKSDSKLTFQKIK